VIPLSFVDFELIFPFAVFGMFAAVAWWLLNLLAAGKPRVEQRLDEFNDPTLRKQAQEVQKKKSSAMSKVLEKASPALARPLQPKTENEMGALKQRLVVAGFRGEAAPSIFLGMKFAGLVAGLVMGGGVFIGLSALAEGSFVAGFNKGSLMRTGVTAGLLFFLPDVFVWFCARKRKEAIFLGLPDALDLMVVCVEAGLGLDQAMRKVAEEMKKTYRIIADEFALANFQIQVGRTRNEVWREMGIRTGVDDVKALATIIIQAEKLGSSIAQALRVQSESMRTRRRQIAEEKAAKTAVKLIFPLVLFIFPAIFVVLVGPAAITMVREMFPKMKGQG